MRVVLNLLKLAPVAYAGLVVFATLTGKRTTVKEKLLMLGVFPTIHFPWAVGFVKGVCGVPKAPWTRAGTFMNNETIRPSNPTLDQLRAVCQPPEVRARRNAEHWTAELYLRHISIYLTAVLVRTRISANGVTGLMILAGWLMSAALLIPGVWGPLLAVVLSQVQLYFDCSDGEVARWRGTQSPRGIFIDMVGHHTTEALIPIALGYRVFRELQDQGADASQAWPTLFIAAVLSVLLVLNRSQSLMVHAARGMAGLGKLPDTAEARAVSQTSLVGKLRPQPDSFPSTKCSMPWSSAS